MGSNVQPRSFQSHGTDLVKQGEWLQFLKHYNEGLASGILDKGTATLTNGLATVASKWAGYGIVFFGSQDTNCLGWMRVDNIVKGVSFRINSTGNTDSGVVAWVLIAF